MKTDGGVGLLRSMQLKRRGIAEEQPLADIETIDLALLKRFFVSVQTVESGLQYFVLILHRPAQGLLLPLGVFYARDKQVMRQQVGRGAGELQLRMLEKGHERVDGAEVEADKGLFAVLLVEVIHHFQDHLCSIVVRLGAPENGICIRRWREHAPRYGHLRRVLRVVEILNQAIYMQVQLAHVLRHLGIFLAIGVHHALVAGAVVHEAEVVPTDEALAFQQLEAGVLVPSAAVFLPVHIPSCSGLRALVEIGVLDIELSHQTGVVLCPCGVGYLVVGAELIIEVHARNIGVRMRRRHHPRYCPRTTVQTAAQNHVYGIHGAYLPLDNGVVGLRQIGGKGFFVCIGGCTVHTVALVKPSLCCPCQRSLATWVTDTEVARQQLQLVLVERNLVVREPPQQVALADTWAYLGLHQLRHIRLKVSVQYKDIVLLLGDRSGYLARLNILGMHRYTAAVGELEHILAVVGILCLRLRCDEVADTIVPVLTNEVIVVLHVSVLYTRNSHVDAGIPLRVNQPPSVSYLLYMVKSRTIYAQIAVHARTREVIRCFICYTESGQLI